MKQKPLFEEKQKFTQWWLWLIIIVPNIVFMYVLNEQLETEENATDLIKIISILLPVSGILFFYFISLKTQITHNKIYFIFFPFHLKNKEYLISDIQEMKVVKYSPIGDYGGWGVRGFGNNKAFNVKGNMGLQILFKDGTKRLIGTQKPEELQKTITELGFGN